MPAPMKGPANVLIYQRLSFYQSIRRFACCQIILMPLLVSGCSRAPSIEIVGSLFPAWLLCLIVGILLATVARWLLLRRQIVLAWPILVYPSLAALFTFLLWLMFFN